MMKEQSNEANTAYFVLKASTLKLLGQTAVALNDSIMKRF